LGLFTTFEDTYPQSFALRIRNHIDKKINPNIYGMSFWTDNDGTDWVNAQSYFKLSGDFPSGNKPTKNLTDYLWSYDRFNDRVYTDDGNHIYKTFVVVKKLSEMDGYDKNAYYTSSSAFVESATYPVLQVYKDDALLFEGKICKYDEEFVYSKEEKGTSTIINVRAETKKNGYYVEFEYEWVGHSQMKIRTLDFSKKSEYADFTEISCDRIHIVKDSKENHKGTGSFDDGNGKTFNYNEGD